jgi:cell division protein FtsN
MQPRRLLQTHESKRMNQRGGFAMGLVAGLLIGLALALGVALYITKAPIPFVNKVPQRTAEQDSAEAERNRSWDPNAGLAGKTAARAASAAAATAAAAANPPLTQTAPTPAPTAMFPPPAVGPNVAASAPATTRPTTTTTPAWRDPAAEPSGSRSTAQAPEPFVYFVQAGAFTRNEDAEAQRAKLAIAGHSARITERDQAGRTVYRVRLGPFPVRNTADDLQQKLQGEGIEAQIVRVEKQP